MGLRSWFQRIFGDDEEDPFRWEEYIPRKSDPIRPHQPTAKIQREKDSRTHVKPPRRN